MLTHARGHDAARLADSAPVRPGSCRRRFGPGIANWPSPAVVIDFTPAMADVWAVADLAISRSGASSCAELTACGIPSILIPYPFHKDMHQRANAKFWWTPGRRCWWTMRRIERKTPTNLRPVVESLLYDADSRRTMADAAQQARKTRRCEQLHRLDCTEMTGTEPMKRIGVDCRRHFRF